MDVVLPMALIYYSVGLAETVKFEKSFVTMGTSLSHFNLLTDKQKTLLKPFKPPGFLNDAIPNPTKPDKE